MLPHARSLAISVGAAIALAAAIVPFASCAVDVDLSDKGCPCPADLLCDPSTNKCVTSLPAEAGPGPTPTSTSSSGPVDRDAGPPPPACTGTSCPCATNADCKDPSTRYCGPDGACVECISTPSDTCTAGGFCNDAHECALGCKTVADCQPGQKCQITTHQCVSCLTDTDCPGKKCSPSGTCVDVCTGTGTPCGTGGTCCAGLCISTTNDVLNCGACGTACSKANASPTCSDSKCSWKCVAGYAHCASSTSNTGCETSLRTVNNCGACGATCTSANVLFATGIACAASGCTYGKCEQGHFDFDGDPTNGCEASCGDKNQICCPVNDLCNSGSGCKPNGTCF